MSYSLRLFGAKAQPSSKVVVTIDDMLSIKDLESIGEHNMNAGSPIDYSKVCPPNRHGLANQSKTFRSFENDINSQFYSDLKPVQPISRDSSRVGLMGYKMGMTHFWDKWGKLQPCTVIQIDRCQVTQVKTKEKDGVDAVQIGIGEKSPRKIRKPQIGHLMKNNLPAKDKLAEFRVSPENFLPVGYCLGPRHFKIGQFVDVKGVSKGKGYQGVIKRWNFTMQNASHGVSKTHRAAGSIGMCEDPGKIFKGKKMAGHMGNINQTVHSQKVIKIDTEKSLLYVAGQVPGPISGVVKVLDGAKKRDAQAWDLLYPTFIEGQNADGKEAEGYQIYEGDKEDPIEVNYHENEVVSGEGADDD